MGIVDSLKNFVFQKGYEEEYDEYEQEIDEYDDDGYERSRDVTYIPSRNTERKYSEGRTSDTIALPSRAPKVNEKDNVYMFPGADNHSIVISEPTDFDAATEVCGFLKQKRTVIVKMEGKETREVQRIMDYIAGMVLALHGDIQQITNYIYIVTPENVTVSDHHKEQLKQSGILPKFKFGSR